MIKCEGVWLLMKKKETERRRENLLNVVSSDVVGIISCHHGLHLHQVLLHFLYTHALSLERLYLSLSLTISMTFFHRKELQDFE